MCNRTPLSQTARTHGLGWRTAHASSIDEKGLIYILKATSAPPRAGTTGIRIYHTKHILQYRTASHTFRKTVMPRTIFQFVWNEEFFRCPLWLSRAVFHWFLQPLTTCSHLVPSPLAGSLQIPQRPSRCGRLPGPAMSVSTRGNLGKPESPEQLFAANLSKKSGMTPSKLVT